MAVHVPAYLSMRQLGIAMEELARLQHQVRLSEVNLHHEVNQCGERGLFSEHMSTGGLPLCQTAQTRVFIYVTT